MMNQGTLARELGPHVSSRARTYRLRCQDCGAHADDDGTVLRGPCCNSASLLRAIYQSTSLKVGPAEEGLFRFADWLPVCRRLEGSAAPITYQSHGLASRFGLDNLWITFTGYWPEREAWTQTGTFKENEAYAVCARLPEEFDQILVVASAGNTARAFGHVCSQHGIPNLLVVPEFALDQLWFQDELNPNVRLLAVKGDYTDAIQLAAAICDTPGFISEGGARNVARRDGMGTTFLSAATTIGELPDHYFQAIGSGTGAIAAWEAGVRLRADPSWGSKKTRLHVAQNAPFTPIIQSWKAKSRILLLGAEEESREQIRQISAKVLANRTPAYSVGGGLHEAMTDSGGDGYAVTNQDAASAFQLFLDSEGIDPSPAASVAIAALGQAVERGTVRKDDLINLNVTGGGIRHRREGASHHLPPAKTVEAERLHDPALLDEVQQLFC